MLRTDIMTPLHIVGMQRELAQSNGLEERGRLYGDFFSRVDSVDRALSPKRVLSFSGCIGEGAERAFIGVEVDKIQNVPEGMTAWELRDSALIVRDASGGACEGKVAWLWRTDEPRPAGEFALVETGLEYRLSGNAYLSVAGPTGVDDVELSRYDPSWPRAFEAFAEWLREKLGEVVLRVEHFGSTAVPGMLAKPIIDVAVQVASFLDAKRNAIPSLNDPSWEYWWYDHHMIFVKRASSGRRTHHLHLAPAGHELWTRLAFRDYLRRHQDEAARYAALKCELATRFPHNRERYTEAKGAFVKELTLKALDLRPVDAESFSTSS